MTCGPFAVLSTFDDDDANAIADREVLESRLIALRQLAFGLSQFDDDVAVFIPLHDAVDDFADVLVILGVNALAFGFADLLKDDLLGHLRRNAAQADGGFQEFDFLVHLRVGLGFARFVQRDFAHRDW